MVGFLSSVVNSWRGGPQSKQQFQYIRGVLLDEDDSGVPKTRVKESVRKVASESFYPPHYLRRSNVGCS